MSLALFVLQSKKLSNLVLPLNTRHHCIHSSIVQDYMYACLIAMKLDMDSTRMVYPISLVTKVLNGALCVWKK